MRIFVFPMYSNTRNLAGDSGLTIPISIIRAIPDWHFYVAFPETWSQQERGLFLFKDLPNVTLVPLRYFTCRNLSNHYLDIPGLARFAETGDLEVDAAWLNVPELVPAWKAFVRQGYPLAHKRKLAPAIAHSYNGLRGWRDPTEVETTVLAQGVGFAAADRICWESPFHRDVTLEQLGGVLSGKALRAIEKGGDVVGLPLDVGEYDIPIEKAERFTVAYNSKLIEQKNPRETFEVLSHFYDLGYDFEVHVFDQSGRGYKVRDLPFVRMADGSNRDRYLKVLSRCHVTMSHTSWDLFSRAYADCLLLEMPLIAPQRCSFPFLCSPGYRYFAESSTAALGLLRHFYEHRDEARKVGRECRAWVRKNFAVENIAGWWRETTEALVRKDREAVLDQCSRKRRDAILATAEKAAAKGDGSFTKMGFEKVFRRLHGYSTAGCIRGNSTKTRAVLLANGFEDDFTREEPTYVRALQ